MKVYTQIKKAIIQHEETNKIISEYLDMPEEKEQRLISRVNGQLIIPDINLRSRSKNVDLYHHLPVILDYSPLKQVLKDIFRDYIEGNSYDIIPKNSNLMFMYEAVCLVLYDYVHIKGITTSDLSFKLDRKGVTIPYHIFEKVYNSFIEYEYEPCSVKEAKPSKITYFPTIDKIEPQEVTLLPKVGEREAELSIQLLKYRRIDPIIKTTSEPSYIYGITLWGNTYYINAYGLLDIFGESYVTYIRDYYDIKHGIELVKREKEGTGREASLAYNWDKVQPYINKGMIVYDSTIIANIIRDTLRYHEFLPKLQIPMQCSRDIYHKLSNPMYRNTIKDVPYIIDKVMVGSEKKDFNDWRYTLVF